VKIRYRDVKYGSRYAFLAGCFVIYIFKDISENIGCMFAKYQGGNSTFKALNENPKTQK